MPTNTNTYDFTQVLAQAHRDNGRRKHFALEGTETVISTMWLTPFVYQYFIYNSLYQVDWDTSLTSGKVTMLDVRYEDRQQEAFEGYLKAALQGQKLRILADAFRKVKNVPVRGEWTRVHPDQRISVEDGEQFFRNIEAFQATLNAITNGDESLPIQQKTFGLISELRSFVYSVRCNIFHGRKPLTEASEHAQNQRIKVYYFFLNGLVEAFFQATEAAIHSR